MILVPDVLLVLGQLCVNGDLVLHDPVQAAVVLLNRHHAVLENARGLTVLGEDLFWLTPESLNQKRCTIKEMEDELEAGVRGEMNSNLFKRRSSEAWQQPDVGRLRGHGVGNLLENLRKTLAIPHWKRAIRRRSDEEQPGLVGQRRGLDAVQELTEHGFDPEGRGSRATLRPRDEICDA